MAFQADFCLSCDKQTQDGAYCSQACRLADYDKAGAAPSSPSCASSYSSSTAFHLTPAFDFDSYRSSSRSAPAPVSESHPQSHSHSHSHSQHSSRHQAKRSSVASFESLSSDYALSRTNSTPSSPSNPQSSLSEETRFELSRYETCFSQSNRRKPSRHF